MELRRRRDRRSGPSRCAPARGGRAARRGEAPRGALARDDPVGARARARRRPQRDHGARRRDRAGDPARRRPAADGEGARDRDGLQPPRPDVRLRDRARGRCADGRRAVAGARARSRARRRRAGRHPGRGSRGLPALHRPRLPRRVRRAAPGLAEGAPAGRRHAPDLEHRRRDELRHAGARLAASRLRHLDAREGRIVVRRAAAGEEIARSTATSAARSRATS